MNKRTSKADIIETLGNKYGLTKIESQKVVDSILNSMIDTLASDGNIEIRGFGSMKVKTYAPRVRRNPGTGESVNVDTQYLVHFKPGEPLREKVNQYVRESL